MAVTSDAEFLKILEQAYEEAWEIVNSEDGWKKEAEEKGTLTNFQFFLSVQNRFLFNFMSSDTLIL